MKKIRGILKSLLVPFSFLKGCLSISKYYVMFTALIALTKTIQPVFSVWMTKLILEELLGQQRTEYLAGIILILISSNLAFFFLQAFFSSKNAVLEDLFKDDFKKMVGKKIMTIGYDSLEAPKTVDLQEKALRPIINYGVLNQLLSQTVPSFIGQVFLLITTAALAFSRFPILAVPLVILMILNTFVLNASKEIRNSTYQIIVPVERKISYFTRLTFDFQSGKEIRLYKMQDFIMDKVRKLNNEDLKAVSKQYKLISRQSGLSAVLSQATMFLIYGYIALQCFHGLSISDYTYYTGLFISLSGAMFGLIENISNLLYQGKFFSAYFEFMALPESPSLPPMDNSPAKEDFISFNNVTYSYPNSETAVLRDLSFSIKKGEHIALVGTNGAGKTTLIKLLCGLYKPQKGSIGIKWGNGAQKQMISSVFQDYKLFAFPIYDNIIMREQKGIDLTDVLRKSDSLSFVQNLPQGVMTCISKSFDPNGINLSGGQEQRIAIARALEKDSPILILDEPTAALDPLAEERIFENFHQITESKTSIMISHRLTSTRTCDRILVLDGGKIAEMGTHEQLMKIDGLYRKMFETQAQYYKENRVSDLL